MRAALRAGLERAREAGELSAEAGAAVAAAARGREVASGCGGDDGTEQSSSPSEPSGIEEVAISVSRAVSLLHAVIRENVTGPSSAGDAGEDDERLRRAVASLSASGEEVVGKVFGAVPMVCCLELFESLVPKDAAMAAGAHVLLVEWWYARATVLRQRMLGGRSAHLYGLTNSLFRRSIEKLEELRTDGIEKLHDVAIADEARDMRSMLSSFWADALAVCHIEAALFQHAYGYAEAAEKHLRAASEVLEVEVSLMGAMGTRTIYQADEKAQLVLQVQRTGSEHVDGSCEEDDSEDEEERDGGEHGCRTMEMSEELRGALEAFDESAEGVMEAPKLAGDHPAMGPLRGVEQVLLLALAAHVRHSQPSDELQMWEMAPYVEAVLSQPRLPVLARRCALLLQARHEKSRSRTRERSMIHMQEAADGDGSTMDSSARRMQFCFSVPFPIKVQMQKELGESMISMGLVGEGMRLFESMELWDSLISCYILLGKRPAGEALVRKRLEVMPDDPRLMNALGDLTGDPSHYEKAWESSGGRNVRSMRSLARYASRKKEWDVARRRWENALRINPIHSQGWFELGYACMQLKDDNRALEAYTRCTQLDHSNAHAWNNIAALSMKNERLDLAFSALSETIRHSNDDWHMWLNYAHVSAKTRNFGPAFRALNRVIDLTKGTKVDVEILEWIVDDLAALHEMSRVDATTAAAALEGGGGLQSGTSGADCVADGEMLDAAAGAGLPAAASIIDENFIEMLIQGLNESEDDVDSTVDAALPYKPRTLEDVMEEKRGRGLELTFNTMKAVLKRCVDSPLASGQSASQMWSVASRFYSIIGEDDVARECLLKQLRALAGTAWRDDARLFDEFALASLGLAASAKKQNTRRALAAARMHLRGVLKQAAEEYGDSDNFVRLSEALAEVTELESDRAGE